MQSTKIKERTKNMENNYLMLDGQKVEFTAEQLETIKKCLGNKRRLSEAAAGETVKIGEWEFIVLEHIEGGTALLMKDLYKSNVVQFGRENNDYRKSIVKDFLDTFADELCDIVGERNVIEHTVDLTSDDGLKDYGTIKAKASLLTSDMYRRFVYIIDKYKHNFWWWLITPHSTLTHENAFWVKCVSPDGNSNNNRCNHFYGVRPFCILNSDIFVS